MIARFLDALLGARCHNCGDRVFDADIVRHYGTQCRGALR